MTMMPLWLELLVCVLVVAGAGVALIGSMGLLTLPSFFARTHAPAIIATLACWCIVHAAFAFFWWQGETAPLRLYLVALFVATTAPITSIFLMRAALFRARRAGTNVPASLSGQASSAQGNGPPSHQG